MDALIRVVVGAANLLRNLVEAHAASGYQYEELLAQVKGTANTAGSVPMVF